MEKGIGAASDYYRLRLMKMDDADAPEFEWREDILWRNPPTSAPSEREVCRVEAVSLDDHEVVVPLGMFESASDASEALTTADEELKMLTRSEFEDRYFPAGM